MGNATIDARLVKQLREETDAGLMECKRALAEAAGDLEKARVLLKERGQAKAEKLEQREVKAGWIGCFVQNGRVGALVELGCNTDFVARNSEFQELARELAIGVVAFHPAGLTKTDLPAELVDQERRKIAAEVAGKPPEIAEKIIEGKLEKNLYAQKCLLHMPYPKEDLFKGTYGELVKSKMSKIGENISVRRFMRLELGF